MSDESKLLNALKIKLKALTLSSGGKAFTDVLISADRVSPQTFYSMPVAVLGVGTSSWDGENPELGTTTIYVDIWIHDVSTPAGTQQLIGERGLTDLRQIMIDGAAHFAGGPFLAAVTLTGASDPMPLEGANGQKVWHMRAEYSVAKG